MEAVVKESRHKAERRCGNYWEWLCATVSDKKRALAWTSTGGRVLE